MVQEAGKGESQPPKKRIVEREETAIMAVYSPMKNMANFMEAYSVWKPATSSDSASGKSKGTRLVSATAEMKKQMQPMICVKPKPSLLMPMMFQPKKPRLPLFCISTISLRLKVPAMSRTPTTESVRESS